MVRATNKTKKKATSNEANKTAADIFATNPFSGVTFAVKPFKKKAKSSNPHKKSSVIRNGLKTVQNLLRSKKTKAKRQNGSNQPAATPFAKVHRNKPMKNYINKSSHLSNITAFKSKLIDDERNGDGIHASLRNNKKVKRVQRRKQLKQRIEETTKWTMEEPKTEDIEDSNTATQNNGDSMSISSLMDSLKDTEEEILLERKQNSKRGRKRQMRHDRDNITALFTNDLFDSNPIEYTNNRLKEEQDSLNMKSEIELKEQSILFSLNGKKKKKYSGKNGNKNEHKITKKERKSKSLLSDKELKKQITKQMSLMKKKTANKKHLKLTANSKLKKRKIKKLKEHKSGKYIEKKMRRRMTNLAKSNQKKRRWRI